MRASRLAALVAAMLVAATAAAQNWPTRPVRWVVPFPAGGSADLMGRLIAPDLGRLLGQQVVVENRAGASAIVAAEYVAKSPADGYTLLQCNVGQMSINPSLYPKLPYDPFRSFAPVTAIASVNNVMVVTPTLPAATVKEFIALAKRRPGELNFTSSGPGSLTHLTGELMKLQAGFSMVHVNYKGSAPAAMDTMAGFVQAMFDNLPAALPNINAGKLRALAMLSKERAKVLPRVPTLHESGFPGYDMVSWQCVAAPAGTPKAVIDQLQGGIAKVLGTPEMRERFATFGADVVASTPEQFGQYLRDETTKWDKVVRDAGVKLEP